MTVWNAVLLGLVQGIAEFLPISSSGHLAIINNLFKLSNVSDGHMLFQALLYLATLISVCIVYWPELTAMLYETLSLMNLGPYAGQQKAHYPAARCLLMIVLSTIPLFLALPLNGPIQTLYGRNVFIGVCLILTGCMLFVSDKMTPGKKSEKNMGVTDALLIGLCQSVAIIPGLSRSAVTITAGIATGLRRDFALTFSFLMSIPAVFGATVLALIDAVQEGMVVAILAGIGAIHLLRAIVRKFRFGSFGYYCWVIGVLSIILHLIF